MVVVKCEVGNSKVCDSEAYGREKQYNRYYSVSNRHRDRGVDKLRKTNRSY